MYSTNEEYLLELLQESGFLTPEDVEEAQGASRGKHSVVETLLELGRVSEQEVAQTMAITSGMEFVDLANFVPEPEVVEALPTEVAAQYHVIPVSLEPGRLVVAVADPMDFQTMDTLPHLLRDHQVDFVCATKSQVQSLLKDLYNVGGPGGGDDLLLETGGEAAESDAPVIKMVSELLQEAFAMRASDIHIEPMEKKLRIRYRVDGVLHEVASHPKHLHAPVLARLKIMTGTMSIDERRVPQDGRIQAKMGKKELDLRVSTVPTNHGESVVMRILDKSGLLLGLSDLGFFSDDQKTFDNLIGLPDGIILVTGPTGSGKTTTLYACLNTINRPDRKIITVEDPVEYQMSGINQVHVKEDIGMTFAAALRAMLRQAPNIIMIGEIRDAETGGIAIQAALTGHLVFSTLHTNDAPSAVARLADIGVKPFLIASAVRAITAQRLVRKFCGECKAPGELAEREMRALRIDAARMADASIMKPVGCPRCRQTGFKGRMCIVEIFTIDDQVRGMINEGLPTTQLKRRARELGMRTLREDGVRKVMAGQTSAQEVIEATSGDAD
ncbi:MAG: type II/IV secretion system protein [Verrucomicrobiales bacterium]|nr:type II/IV secretion system protein [Verrucomicrobiales bacterium]